MLIEISGFVKFVCINSQLITKFVLGLILCLIKKLGNLISHVGNKNGRQSDASRPYRKRLLSKTERDALLVPEGTDL